MQNLIIPKPYEFVPPRFNTLVYRAFSPLLPLMLRKAYGVAPHQWVDYRVIVGDPSDGIVGCKNLGDSAARHCWKTRSLATS